MSDEPEIRWLEDTRILSIVAAPSGWYSLTRRDDDNGYDPTGGSIHDVAYVEPIAFFALLETVERRYEITKDEDGEDVWESTRETDVDKDGGFPHTYVKPVAWHSGEEHFPGADELGLLSSQGLVVNPMHDLNASWIRACFGPKT